MSSEMPWLKWYTEALDDPKFGRLTDQQKWRFVEACTIAAECDCDGLLLASEKPMTLEDIAWRIRSTVEHISQDYQTLIELGMIGQNENGAYYVVNFSKRQGRPWHERRERWKASKKVQRSSENVLEDTSRTDGGHLEDKKNVLNLEERREEEEEEEEERRGNTPPASNSFSGTERGAMVFKMMKAEYRNITDHFETNAQRDAYLAVFECLNGELETVVKKALAKGIRTKGDMLVWLQGCAKRDSKKSQSSGKRSDKAGKTYL
jgi:predicted transcriptional regulator